MMEALNIRSVLKGSELKLYGKKGRSEEPEVKRHESTGK
jgi:hypothetical protein